MLEVARACRLELIMENVYTIRPYHSKGIGDVFSTCQQKGVRRS